VAVTKCIKVKGDSLAGVIGPPMYIIWRQNQVTPNLVLRLLIFFLVSDAHSHDNDTQDITRKSYSRLIIKLNILLFSQYSIMFQFI